MISDGIAYRGQMTPEEVILVRNKIEQEYSAATTEPKKVIAAADEARKKALDLLRSLCPHTNKYVAGDYGGDRSDWKCPECGWISFYNIPPINYQGHSNLEVSQEYQDAIARIKGIASSLGIS